MATLSNTQTPSSTATKLPSTTQTPASKPHTNSGWSSLFLSTNFFVPLGERDVERLLFSEIPIRRFGFIHRVTVVPVRRHHFAARLVARSSFTKKNTYTHAYHAHVLTRNTLRRPSCMCVYVYAAVFFVVGSLCSVRVSWMYLYICVFVLSGSSKGKCFAFGFIGLILCPSSTNKNQFP